MSAAQTLTQFKVRGLIGFLLIVTGLSLALIFKKESSFTIETKALMLACAYCCGIGGGALLTSYMQQASFRRMKTSLAGMGFLLAFMLLNCLRGIL